MEDCSYTMVRKNRADIRIVVDSEGQKIITAPVEVNESQLQEKIVHTVFFFRLTAPEYEGILEMTFPIEK